MKKIISILVLVGFLSCGTEPQPIVYGHDACHHCAMTIVSDSYAAQAVSVKGKQYKYDSIECMMNAMAETEEEMAVWQVSDYLSPGRMLPVDEVRFVINDSLKSPMGANLAALDKGKAAGATMDWESLKRHFTTSKMDHGKN